MKESVFYAQTPTNSVDIPIPTQGWIVPVLLPGVIANSDGTLVRIDVKLLIEANSTSSGLALDYEVILLRDEEFLCSRHFCHTNTQGTESDIVSFPLSFSFTDVLTAGYATYALQLVANSEATLKANRVLLQDCSLLATVSEPPLEPLPKDSLIVCNWKMGSLFLCIPIELERVIPTGQNITAGEWLPDGSAFYGVDVRSNSNLIRLDALTSQISHILPRGIYGEPKVSHDGQYVYITDETSVIQIDTETHNSKHMNFLKQEIPPLITLHPNDDLLFVGLEESGIEVIDTVTMKSIGSYPIKERSQLYITKDGNLLVAVNNEIVVVTLENSTKQVVGELRAPFAASAYSSRFGILSVVDKNKNLYFSNLKNKKILNPITITIPYSPMRFLYVDDDRGFLYVPMWDDNSQTSYLSIVDLKKRSIIATKPIEPGILSSLCVMDDSVFVSMLDRILLLDPDTLEYLDHIHTGLSPFSLHFRPLV